MKPTVSNFINGYFIKENSNHFVWSKWKELETEFFHFSDLEHTEITNEKQAWTLEQAWRDSDELVQKLYAEFEKYLSIWYVLMVDDLTVWINRNDLFQHGYKRNKSDLVLWLQRKYDRPVAKNLANQLWTDLISES